MRIEILSFEECPNAQTARDRVLAALRLENVAAEVEAIEVTTFDRAQEVRFLGSPSVRVNGIDVEARAENVRDYGLMCRTYHTGGRIEGAPPLELIRAAIRCAGSPRKDSQNPRKTGF